MRNKLFFTLMTVLSFGLLNVAAQESPKPPMPIKSISGGVLNGKATTLTKPAYPAAARAVNAGGAVNVQVTIDENGDVISASAVSGHPLLRKASEQAALTSKFAPTTLQDQPVKVTGVIVYNFVSPMTFTQIGYELALAETSQSMTKSKLGLIRQTFSPSWAEEIEALTTLDSRLTTKVAQEKSVQTSAPTNAEAVKLNPPNGIYQGSNGGIVTRIGSVGMSATEKYVLDGESVAIIRELQSKLESRLNNKDNVLWSFRLGKILGKLKAEVDSDEKMRANLAELNQLGAVIPSGISESAAAGIKELNESGEQTTADGARREKILQLIENLQNSKIY